MPLARSNIAYWGRVMHICVGELNNIGSDNGLSPDRRHAIIWTNAVILLIWPLGTNCNEMLIKVHTFSFKKMYVKMSSAKWRPFCLGINMLRMVRHNTILHIARQWPGQNIELGVVSLTFRELSKIILRKYTMPEMTFIMRISCWNFVRAPKAWLWAHVQSFSLKFS